MLIHSILLYSKYRWFVVTVGHGYAELRGVPFTDVFILEL